MFEPINLKIGTTVRILPEEVGDRLPAKLLKLLSDDPLGICLNYKITDGQGIGYVVQLGDGSISWFFAHELQSLDSLERTLPPNVQRLQQEVPNGLGMTSNTVIELLNPLNFLRWLNYSLKDIF